MPAGSVAVKAAQRGYGCGDSPYLFDAAHLHTGVLSFYHHHYVCSTECVAHGFGYLLSEAFLHLEATGIDFHGPCQLGEAGNVPVGQIGYVNMAEEGEKVVFAEGVEGDFAHQDEALAFAGIEQGAPQYGSGILAVPPRYFRQGFGHAFGGFHKAFALGIFANVLEEGFNMILYHGLRGV